MTFVFYMCLWAIKILFFATKYHTMNPRPVRHVSLFTLFWTTIYSYTLESHYFCNCYTVLNIFWISEGKITHIRLSLTINSLNKCWLIMWYRPNVLNVGISSVYLKQRSLSTCDLIGSVPEMYVLYLLAGWWNTEPT